MFALSLQTYSDIQCENRDSRYLPRFSNHNHSEAMIMAENQSTVEYRDIQGFPGYRVGSDGSVWTQWKSVCVHDRNGKVIGRRSFLHEWNKLAPESFWKRQASKGLDCTSMMERKQSTSLFQRLSSKRLSDLGRMVCRRATSQTATSGIIQSTTFGGTHKRRQSGGHESAWNSTVVGKDNPSATLTEQQVYAIRELQGKETSRAVGVMFSIHHRSVLVAPRSAWRVGVTA